MSKTLTAAQANAVRRLKSAKLALGVEAFDAAGNTAKKTTTLALSRPKR